MIFLKVLHVAAIAAWFGSAAADVVLEAVLRRTSSPEAQRAFIRLHRAIDLVVEGPGIALAVTTGLAMLWWSGRLADLSLWPSHVRWMVLCGGVAAAANAACVAFVVRRDRAAASCPAGAAPLADQTVRRWHLAVALTGLGIPFALVALWHAVARGA